MLPSELATEEMAATVPAPKGDPKHEQKIKITISLQIPLTQLEGKKLKEITASLNSSMINFDKANELLTQFETLLKNQNNLSQGGSHVVATAQASKSARLQDFSGAAAE